LKEMHHRIELSREKKLIGIRHKMGMAENKTRELWQRFMPRRQEIRNNLTQELISMQLFPPSFNFMDFDPEASFEKWAAVEVSDFDQVPQGMETFILQSGLYAVFEHKGGPATGYTTFRNIFENWLPASGYDVDNRPHFELLGEKYRNNDPESEEEIWIPVRIDVRSGV